METTTFVRAMDVRALLEGTAIVRLIDALDEMIAAADAKAAGDAIAEHCAASWRRRRDALVHEHAALVSGEVLAS